MGWKGNNWEDPEQNQLLGQRNERSSTSCSSWSAGRKISDHSHLVSMRLECLPGLKQCLQAGKNTWPSIGAGSVSGVILGPLVMRHCYFGGFGLGHQFDSCA